ncbi:hypothetical protein [Ectopseudomonas oleovorans]|uniref:Uncharacterized protein n=1 Tax=Ectopseudomonas oleovorans TaxID=301 RepID=A0A3R8X2B0_ECTOL|nr:hypothetical protein [Pseudomonas oleovorans]RRW38488.1 hypothetical protein EGJ44_03875 [Pseudomonas oleovorans]
MAAVLALVPAAPKQAPACTVLTEEFANRLSALNSLNRDLRAAGVQVVAQDVESTTLTIDRASVPQLVNHFSKRLRGLLSRTEGHLTRHRAEIGRVSVVWFSPVKEQDA